MRKRKCGEEEGWVGRRMRKGIDERGIGIGGGEIGALEEGKYTLL